MNSKIYITSKGFVSTHLQKAFKDNLVDNIQSADIVINTVGILKQTKYTYEESHVEFVKNLIPKLKNKKLIHFSALGSRLNHPSKYMHTKAVAEKLIKQNLSNYAIIKPSIILGEGQKLYEDLEKFRFMPFLLVPKMKVQPVKIDQLITLVKEIINKDLKGEFNLCGEKVMSMKELFLSVFMTFGKSPYLFEMPKQFFLLAYPLLSLFDIISKDEVLMIEDNICKDKNG